MDDRPESLDATLAARIAAGDEGAFMAVYDAHASLLFGVVTRFLADRETAAEVVQETYLALWQRATLYRHEAGSLRTWLLRIARNRALDRLRAEARRPRLVSAEPATADGPTRSAMGEARARPSEEPEASLERRWLQAVVRAALAAMPEDERTVLVLAYDEELSQSQIAAHLGLPIGTVKSRTRRAMARLRELLAAVPDLRVESAIRVADGSPGSR